MHPRNMSNDSLVSRWLREPLVHFLLLGGSFFVLYWAVGGSQSAASDRTIRLAEGDVQRLAAAWQLQWSRPPSVEELTNLVKEHIREEIFYREALALGLDQDDSIVRRRLAQKMQFLSEDVAEQQEPSDDELRKFFVQNSERFEIPARVTFTHIYFSVDKRSDRADDDAKEALEAIRGGADPAGIGDRFMLQNYYAVRSKDDIAGMFGAAFAEDLFGRRGEGWHGPVKSGYGLHLVRVEQRIDALKPAWEKVRAEVASAWSDENRRTANDKLYEKLRGEYDIDIAVDLPEPMKAAIRE